MYTINIKVKPNPKDPSMVKLEMIFFKTNYPRRVWLVCGDSYINYVLLGRRHINIDLIEGEYRNLLSIV